MLHQEAAIGQLSVKVGISNTEALQRQVSTDVFLSAAHGGAHEPSGMLVPISYVTDIIVSDDEDDDDEHPKADQAGNVSVRACSCAACHAS